LREVICKGLLGFSGGSAVKNLLSMHETRVQALGQEEPLEEDMVTHSSILASDDGATCPVRAHLKPLRQVGRSSIGCEKLYVCFPGLPN